MFTAVARSVSRMGLIVLAMALVLAPTVQAETPDTEPKGKTVAVSQALVSDEMSLPLPVFHDAELAGVTLEDLVADMAAIPGQDRPDDGTTFAGLHDGSHKWSETKADDGQFKFAGDPDQARVRYLAFYVQTDRWQKVDLIVESDQHLVAALDGTDLSLTKEDQETGPSRHETTLTLAIGKHLITVRSLLNVNPDDKNETTPPWSIGCELVLTPETDPNSILLSVDPKHTVDIQLVLNAPRFSSLSLSPDGKLAAVALGEYRDGSNREQWLEIRDAHTGDLKHSWRGAGQLSSVAWSPEGQMLSFKTNQGEASTLWIYDLKQGSVKPLVSDVEKMGGYDWAPDGSSVIYSVNRSPEDDPRRVKRVLHPADRQPWWRGRSHLMQVAVPDGQTRQLTAGPLSLGGSAFSPDGSQILMMVSEPTPSERPFSTSELWLLDLETLAARMVLNDPWIGGAVWSPDGKTLCLQGSASAFDGLGRNLPEGRQANDYGGQLYLYDLKTDQAEPITVDFTPTINNVVWSEADGYLYATTTDTKYQNIYRFKPGRDTWEKVETGLQVTDVFVVAKDARHAVAYGSGATTPNQLHAIDLKKNRAQLLLDPGQKHYQDAVFGKVEDWVCTLPDGGQLDGHVYYPPGFDEHLSYPMIVYYYGGTSPITLDFGGRYPKNIWAGQNYIVYIPNPSGATGYGQEYASRHVNDWGILTADEVINGTKTFLAEHPFVDPERVGCMGASYGGFLTEYLITRTDIFAAAVSHAGISSISSYWGEGMWGYAYGARALANAYPWQDQDLYVQQSPLFAADKITTPLLLVHGDSDINVPIGESDQLFTALKILGKDVEYVQIQGQDHHILDHKQRIVWNDTILAYFAKYLKGRPDWWDHMYPAPKDFR